MKWLNGDRMRLMVVGVVAAIVLGGGSARADFTFGEPANLGPTVNSPSGGPNIGDDVPNCFSADGLEMYIMSRRTDGQGLYDILVAQRETVNDEWGTPVNLGSPVNSSTWDAGAYISADGLELYFDSSRSGGYGSYDIWITKRTRKDNAWGIPENLGPVVNSSAGDATPWISPDGLELYFTSNRSGGFGDWDIWVSRRATKDDPWEQPTNLGPIVNSSACDWGALSPDGLLLFGSDDIIGPIRPEGFGGSDLWMTRRATISDPWGVPVNLGPIVNGPRHDCCPRISPDGSTLYFSSMRPGGLGGPYYGDIWQAPIIPIVDFNGDGKVDSFEVCRMADRWGTDDSLCDIGPAAWGDGIVDLEDLKVLAEHIGKEVVDGTLIANWALDETEGDIAYDSVGACDGTLLGTPLWHPDAGMIDGALELDGSTFVAADHVLSPPDGPFSVLAWVKGGTPGQVILSQVDGENWLCTDPTNGCLMTELKGTGRDKCTLCSDAIVADESWHRIALVCDGDDRSLYVDDVFVAEDTQAGGFQDCSGGLNIGCGKDMALGTFFTGLIDDIRIYNRAVWP